MPCAKVRVRFSPEPQYSDSVTTEMAYPTDSTGELLGWALRGLEGVFREGYRYKKAGVMLSGLVAADGLTKRLFGNADYERARRVMKAVDEINARHGRDTVRYGAAPPDGRWRARFARRSPRYMTRLEEVLTIN